MATHQLESRVGSSMSSPLTYLLLNKVPRLVVISEKKLSGLTDFPIFSELSSKI